MRYYVILLVSIAVIVSSCHKKKSVEITLGKTVFSYDSIASNLNEEKFKYDSLFIERVGRDSLIITRYLGGDGFCNSIPFLSKNGVFYEERITPQEIIEGETETSIISIPTFLLGDTAFTYTPEDDFFPVFVVDLSFDKTKYEIRKNNNGFITFKQSLVDTTYTETYFYDDKFNIYKFINTWQDNKCVYVGNVPN
jgi:hypothetical protein